MLKTKTMLKTVACIAASILLYSCASTGGMGKQIPLSKLKKKDSVTIHVAQRNVRGLIADYGQRYRVRDAVAGWLFHTNTYDDATYADLLDYRRLADSDSVLTLGFDSIIGSYQARAVSAMDGMTDGQIAGYYRDNPLEQDFLRPFIMEVTLDGLDDRDYTGLRTLHRTFHGTDLQDSIAPAYLKKRDELLPTVRSNVQKYCKTELAVVDRYKRQFKASLASYISQAAEGAAEKLLDQDLPRERKDVVSFYRNLCSSSVNTAGIKERLRQPLHEMLQTINSSRDNYIRELAGREAYGDYHTGSIVYRIGQPAVSVPVNDLMAVSRIQNKTDWVGLGLGAASLLTGGVAGLLLGGIDALRSYNNGQKDAKQMTPHIKRIVKTTTTNIRNSVNKSVDNAFKQIRQGVAASQKKFQKAVYDNY